MFFTSRDQFLVSNSHLFRYHHVYSAKKNWSKMLIPAWNKGSNILLPHIWSHHRLLYSMTKLKEHSREICELNQEYKGTSPQGILDYIKYSSYCLECRRRFVFVKRGKTKLSFSVRNSRICLKSWCILLAKKTRQQLNEEKSDLMDQRA